MVVTYVNQMYFCWISMERSVLTFCGCFLKIRFSLVRISYILWVLSQDKIFSCSYLESLLGFCLFSQSCCYVSHPSCLS
jgi:hypothetical protein